MRQRQTTVTAIIVLLITLLPCCVKAANGVWNGCAEIRSGSMAMLLSSADDGSLQITYFGYLPATDVIDSTLTKKFRPMSALPTFGTDDVAQPMALQITHGDGQPTTNLQVTTYAVSEQERYVQHTFTMVDTLHRFEVHLHYKAYKHVPMIEAWTEYVNNSATLLVLNRFDSATLPLPQSAAWLTHLHGSWANECRLIEERLTDGIKTLFNTDGARNTQTTMPAVMITLNDSLPAEDRGLTLAATLAWSGNYELRIASQEGRYHQFFAGINPQASHYRLDSGATLVTPRLAFTLTNEGKGGASRNFHQWARDEKMLHRGNGTGDILLNSWEGVYFDVNQPTVKKMIKEASKMGCELFVVDDGWFGTTYRRDNSSALGDWNVDIQKLRDGLQPLIDIAIKHGMKFGIWIEPEAVNTRSELFEKHPDWALQAKGIKPTMGRGETQMLLDMTNPEVQRFVYSIVDRLLTDYPQIAYIKWDANVPLHNYGSAYLAADKQQNLYVDYHKALENIIHTIREKYPDVVIQACASGGGRMNYGLLPYFDECWLSDNNDAFERVKKQYGASLFLPANALATHVGSSPDHTTGRIVPIKYRTDVAMNGRMGLELLPQNMTETEKQQTKRAIADYKLLRKTIQTGQQYRLRSPYDNDGIAATMYLDSDTQAVLLVYQTTTDENTGSINLHLCHLPDGVSYMIEEKNVAIGETASSPNGKIVDAETLKTEGLTIPLSRQYASRVYLLTPVGRK